MLSHFSIVMKAACLLLPLPFGPQPQHHPRQLSPSACIMHACFACFITLLVRDANTPRSYRPCPCRPIRLKQQSHVPVLYVLVALRPNQTCTQSVPWTRRLPRPCAPACRTTLLGARWAAGRFKAWSTCLLKKKKKRLDQRAAHEHARSTHHSPITLYRSDLQFCSATWSDPSYSDRELQKKKKTCTIPPDPIQMDRISWHALQSASNRSYSRYIAQRSPVCSRFFQKCL
jgi:hypothetical protein